MTHAEILGFVRANVDELIERKRRLEREMNPLPDIAWQYADGLVNGAREVLGNLTKAFWSEQCSNTKCGPFDSDGRCPVHRNSTIAPRQGT